MPLRFILLQQGGIGSSSTIFKSVDAGVPPACVYDDDYDDDYNDDDYNDDDYDYLEQLSEKI